MYFLRAINGSIAFGGGRGQGGAEVGVWGGGRGTQVTSIGRSLCPSRVTSVPRVGLIGNARQSARTELN